MNLIAVFVESLQVSGEGGGVAGDVDDGGGFAGDEGVDEAVVEAFAGGIDDNEVRGRLVFDLAGQPGFGFGGDKAGIANAQLPGVVTGIAGGVADGLNANKAFGVPGQVEANGADAAIEVKNGFPAG